MESLPISKVRPNSDNPRYIKDEKFKKLVQSLRDFPEMANVRPIVVNKEMIVLGGNMRLKAMQEAGWSEVPVQVVDWSEEKQREFIIKDNVGFGEWDWDELANTWDAEELKDWGLDVWQPEEDLDYSGANQEIDVDNLDGSMTIKLNYTEEDYWKVKEALSKVAETPEDAVCKLLNL
jgi:hypothetical protein